MVQGYFEDYAVGQTVNGSTTIIVTTEAIKSFASQFDFQPFHLDEAAGKESLFRGLAASGWHTMAMTMKLLLESDFKPVGGIISSGSEGIQWLRPIRPGDILSCKCEVLGKTPSPKGKPVGIMKMRISTLNVDGEPVQAAIMNILVPFRPT